MLLRENNLYLLIKAMRYLEKQKIIDSIGWKRKRVYLKRENAVHCGKKRSSNRDLAPTADIIYKCTQVPDLYLVGI